MGTVTEVSPTTISGHFFWWGGRDFFYWRNWILLQVEEKTDLDSGVCMHYRVYWNICMCSLAGVTNTGVLSFSFWVCQSIKSPGAHLIRQIFVLGFGRLSRWKSIKFFTPSAKDENNNWRGREGGRGGGGEGGDKLFNNDNLIGHQLQFVLTRRFGKVPLAFIKRKWHNCWLSVWRRGSRCYRNATEMSSTCPVKRSTLFVPRRIFFFCQYLFYKDGQIANRS